jgi:signal transduction histidine kinase
VIVNLIMNAVDAMDGIQDRRRTITVSTRCEDPAMAVTEVSDKGSGMDSATLSRVFDPLYTTKSQGLGIGLSICRSIVAAHDGHISARSVPGEGSSFTFALPMMT